MLQKEFETSIYKNVIEKEEDNILTFIAFLVFFLIVLLGLNTFVIVLSAY